MLSLYFLCFNSHLDLLQQFAAGGLIVLLSEWGESDLVASLVRVNSQYKATLWIQLQE